MSAAGEMRQSGGRRRAAARRRSDGRRRDYAMRCEGVKSRRLGRQKMSGSGSLLGSPQRRGAAKFWRQKQVLARLRATASQLRQDRHSVPKRMRCRLRKQRMPKRSGGCKWSRWTRSFGLRRGRRRRCERPGRRKTLWRSGAQSRQGARRTRAASRRLGSARTSRARSGGRGRPLRPATKLGRRHRLERRAAPTAPAAPAVRRCAGHHARGHRALRHKGGRPTLHRRPRGALAS